MIIKKGQTEKHEFTFTDDLGAFNLTDCTMTFLVEDMSGNELYRQEITVFDAPATGIQVVTIPKEDSYDIPAGNAKTEVTVDSLSGERYFSDIYSTKIIKTLNYDIIPQN